jgi:hypothetical protein
MDTPAIASSSDLVDWALAERTRRQPKPALKPTIGGWA